ncbi:putative 4-hydroxy-tetrahydrodipicolinate reductase 3 chloroplastic-like isoform X2 [Tripterygium wilfordii]|uniref:Putative 4-hydroxy-tetrahydrodipicolinate reductase 3 chloroplastic-like isoform X2 n=1 Tax=Tripterygium wilfordii TaxID=458696 RepID=A0A7J7CDW4_TRIWF|nr:putative 4-hydroxy-tetrahydrodipicolinate reductase 3 chloroplastic-like isoform X2 [Tripterygium wilfordii]
MEEPMEIPRINDLTMVLGSISQATTFRMKSVVYVPRIKPDRVTALSTFCGKASMVSPGCAKSMSGLSGGTNTVSRIHTPPASHPFSFIPLQ